MADRLGFSRRYNSDKNFKTAVEDFIREAIFVNMGIDPDRIAQCWDGDRRKFTVTPLDLMAEKLGLVKPGDVAERRAEPTAIQFDGVPEKSPVADLDAKGAKEKIAATGVGDLAFLKDVFLSDTRSGVALEAARRLFDLRTAQE